MHYTFIKRRPVWLQDSDTPRDHLSKKLICILKLLPWDVDPKQLEAACEAGTSGICDITNSNAGYHPSRLFSGLNILSVHPPLPPPFPHPPHFPPPPPPSFPPPTSPPLSTPLSPPFFHHPMHPPPPTRFFFSQGQWSNVLLYAVKQRLLSPSIPFDVETLILKDGGTVRVAFADDPMTRALPTNAPIVRMEGTGERERGGESGGGERGGSGGGGESGGGGGGGGGAI